MSAREDRKKALMRACNMLEIPWALILERHEQDSDAICKVDLDYIVEGLYWSFLSWTFTWSNTPEGHDFWLMKLRALRSLMEDYKQLLVGGYIDSKGERYVHN